MILCTACLPRPRLQQISDLSEHKCVVRIEGCVVRIERGVVKKCKLVVKTLKTVVKNKQFITAAAALGPGRSRGSFTPGSGQSGNAAALSLCPWQALAVRLSQSWRPSSCRPLQPALALSGPLTEAHS
jgi:hypothetical protein